MKVSSLKSYNTEILKTTVNKFLQVHQQCFFSFSTHGLKQLFGIILTSLAILFLSSPMADAMMGGQGLMWTVLQSAPVELKVCWENPSVADPLAGETDQTPGWQRREWVRLALKHSWEREGRIVFTGWQNCMNETNPTPPPHTLGPRRPGTADENIKIFIKTTGGSQNPAHGSWGDYQTSGVLLNLHCGDQSCIEFLTIHEFGHALGLYHEEERGDWPTNIANCPRQTHPPSAPWWPIPTERRWGDADRYSVMAYCSNEPTNLSINDVSSIQRAYNRHLPGTLLSRPGSLCLSGHADEINGSDTFGWECNEANDDQEWKYSIDQKALYIQWPGNSDRRCLDMDTNNNSDVQIWDCHYGTNQQWQFQDVLIRGYGGLCLTRPSSGAVGSLTMKSCDVTDSNQIWDIEQGLVDNSVRFHAKSANLCLAADGGQGSDAVVTLCSPEHKLLPMVIKTKSGKTTVSLIESKTTPSGWLDFYLTPGGGIQLPSFSQEHLCLDVQDVLDSDFTDGKGGPAEGQRVQFFNCYDTQLNQKWNFSGHIVTAAGKCLSLSSPATANGAPANVSSCSANTRQNWDYYW